MKRMTLADYPNAIAGIERSILMHEKEIRAIQEAISLITAEVDRVIAFSDDLKNETQRKARKAELLAADERYPKAQAHLQTLIDRRDGLKIDLTYYRNEFSVNKLQLRDAITQREAIAA